MYTICRLEQETCTSDMLFSQFFFYLLEVSCTSFSSVCHRLNCWESRFHLLAVTMSHPVTWRQRTKFDDVIRDDVLRSPTARRHAVITECTACLSFVCYCSWNTHLWHSERLKVNQGHSRFLADRTAARNVISYWHDTVVRPSVCDEVYFG